MSNALFYKEQGTGPVVVLLHGFCETNEIWNPIGEQLAAEYRIISVDLPGFGASPILKSSFTIEEVANTVLGLLEDLHIIKCVLIGHSLGGYVSLSMAHQKPSLLNGLCLFHSTAISDTEEKRINRNKVIEFVSANGVQPYIDTFVPGLFFQKELRAVQTFHQIASKTSKSAILGYSRAMRDRPDMTGFLSDFQYPLLYLAGNQDSIIPISTLFEQVKKAPFGKLVAMDGVGHMGMYEDTKQSLDILKIFCRDCFPAMTP